MIIYKETASERAHFFTSGQTIVLVQHAVLCVRKFIDERRALELMFDLKNLCPLFYVKCLRLCLLRHYAATAIVYIETLEDLYTFCL